MKKGITVVIIAAILITVCILEFAYVRKTFDVLEADIKTLMTEIENDNENVRRDATLSQVQKISDYWHKRKTATQVMLNHLLLIEYDAKIARLKSDIEINDRNLSKIDVDQLYSMTAELKELHSPFVQNVF